jgi:uncharacterized protein YkwD
VQVVEEGHVERRSRIPRLVAAAALAVCSLLAGAAPASAACANAGVRVTQSNVPQALAATFCLHNEERAARGLPRLRWSTKLARAAESHSRDMVARRFFAHDSPGGGTLRGRLDAVGYVPRGASWAIGENIAWGSGSYATPQSTMTRWMQSPGHRANILDRRFRDLGLGIVPGAPVAGYAGAATFTADFGWRDVPDDGTVTSGPGGSPSQAPSPPASGTRSPDLRITYLRLRRNYLGVCGRIDSEASGPVNVNYTASAGWRRYWARRQVRASTGRFCVSFRVSGRVQRATVAARYAGDRRFAAQTRWRLVSRG